MDHLQRTIVVAGDIRSADDLSRRIASAGTSVTCDLMGLEEQLALGADLVVCTPEAEDTARRIAGVPVVVLEAGAGAPDRVQEELRTLVETIPAVTYLAEWTEEAPLRYLSPQVEALLGHPAERFLGREGLDAWYDAVHPADRERLREEVRRTFLAGSTLDIEYRMVARDGHELWVWESDRHVRDRHGAPQFTHGIIVDITAHRGAADRARSDHERMRSYLDAAGTTIAVLDREHRIVLLNRAGHELLGHEDGALLGRSWFEAAVPEDEAPAALAAFEGLIRAEERAHAAVHEHSVRTSAGELRAVAWHTTALRDAGGEVTGTLSTGIDLTERRAAEQQIAHLAYHDSLTGLPNRALLQEHLELALARSERAGNALAVLYLDLDDFKLVNDSLGHSAGDELLCHIALRLTERRRGGDILARHGGDEFLLLMSDLDPAAAPGAARSVADELLKELQRPFTIAGAEFHIGASVGIALFPEDARSSEGLLRHADAAMYHAKANGRNGVSRFAGDQRQPRERLSMSSRLRKALLRDELLLFWQPIVDPRDGTLHKVEALIRWQDPEQGLVAPSDFIPFAEETGLIDRVGEWVVGAVVDQMARWEREGYAAPPVTVNVSPRQLRRPDFAVRMCRQVSALAAAGMVTVEVTESAAMAEPSRTEPALRELSEAGIQIAIDDFGAGYSSLTRLRTLPVQLLKIDRSFLRGVPGDPEAAAIVTAMIDLAAALGMSAIAEGVETEEQRQFLIDAGCPLAQGFLLGRPMPADELLTLLVRSGPGAGATAS